MFFRRQHPKQPTFEGRLSVLRQAGFSTQLLDGRKVKVARGGCAALVEDVPGQVPKILAPAGILMGDSIGYLVDGGFQKFFETPDGRRKPALASELSALHELLEDLREALGLASLYNESLGTVSSAYRYDRLTGRGQGTAKA